MLDEMATQLGEEEKAVADYVRIPHLTSYDTLSTSAQRPILSPSPVKAAKIVAMCRVAMTHVRTSAFGCAATLREL